MAQEYSVLHKIDLDEASDKIEEILGIPKDVDFGTPPEEEIEPEEVEEEEK